MTSTYSDLPETVIRGNPEHEGLQAEPPEKILWTAPERLLQEQKYPVEDHRQQGKEAELQHSSSTQGRKRTICGLVPWLFWSLLALLALLVIAAAVGGGVAGHLASKHNNNKDAYAAGADTTTAAASNGTSSGGTLAASATSTTSASITTTEIVSATETLYRDCPSVNDTIYSYGPTDSPLLFRQFCNTALLNDDGIDAVINQGAVLSLASCIDLCAAYDIANETDIADGKSPICNSVCWRNTFDTDYPGYCFGYTSQNSSGTFSFTPTETVCDAAAWINQSY